MYLDRLSFDVSPLELVVIEIRSCQLCLLQRGVAHLHSTKATQIAELYIITISLEYCLEFALYSNHTKYVTCLELLLLQNTKLTRAYS